MGLFHHSDVYRLADRKPGKQRKKRHIQTYREPKALSLPSCMLLLLLAAAFFLYGTALLIMRFAGAEAEAAPNTRSDPYGQVVALEMKPLTSTLYFTFRDTEGGLHEGSASLLGNSEPIGETVRVRYLPDHPEWVMLSSRTEGAMIPTGSLLLSAILVRTVLIRLREMRRSKKRYETL